jgi:hypothetical protein
MTPKQKLVVMEVLAWIFSAMIIISVIKLIL